MNWISIKDKLPELNKYVLIHLIDGTWPDFDIPIYQVAELRKKYNNTFRFEEYGVGYYPLDQVDYWCEIEKIKEI